MNPILKLSIYIIISLIITFYILLQCKKNITNQRKADRILLITAILTVILHLSIIIYDLLFTKDFVFDYQLFLPIYPCNVIMWLLLIVSLFKNKTSKIFNLLAEFIFLVGTLCGLIGIVANINFFNNPTFSDFNVLKGLLSHSTMIFGCLYLYIMNYISINSKRNIFSVSIGLIIFIICGLFVNTLYKILQMDPVNSMYLQTPPFPKYPYINFITLGVIGLIIIYGFTRILELINKKRKIKKTISNEVL